MNIYYTHMHKEMKVHTMSACLYICMQISTYVYPHVNTHPFLCTYCILQKNKNKSQTIYADIYI